MLPVVGQQKEKTISGHRSKRATSGQSKQISFDYPAMIDILTAM